MSLLSRRVNDLEYNMDSTPTLLHIHVQIRNKYPKNSAMSIIETTMFHSFNNIPSNFCNKRASIRNPYHPFTTSTFFASSIQVDHEIPDFSDHAYMPFVPNISHR